MQTVPYGIVGAWYFPFTPMQYSASACCLQLIANISSPRRGAARARSCRYRPSWSVVLRLGQQAEARKANLNRVSSLSREIADELGKPRRADMSRERKRSDPM